MIYIMKYIILFSAVYYNDALIIIGISEEQKTYSEYSLVDADAWGSTIFRL